MAELQNTPLPAERARLPALPAAELSVDFLARIKEILETMQGARGTGWDRSVTLRDLQTMGLAAFTGGSLGAETGGLQVAAPQIPVTTQLDQLDALIRETRAYKALMSRIGSAESYEGLPDEVRAQLEPALLEEARKRGAELRDIELKIQHESRSLAYRMTEITAALNESAAGVRSFNSAYADDLTAMATRIEQLSAQVGEGGGSAEIEERLDVLASAIDGLKAQYTLKVQTNPTNGQPPVIAGIALAAESPIEGPGTSSLIFMAERIAFLTGSGSVNPFSISGNQVKISNAIAESLKVIMADGTVVLDAGRTLESQTRIRPNLVASIMAWSGFAGGATPNTSQADDRFINHQYLYLPGSQSYVGADSNPLGIGPNEYYTVSFDAYCEGAPRTLNVDVYGTGVDSTGISISLTNTQTHYKFTEQMGNFANPRGAWLRVFAGPGSNIVFSNPKVEIGTDESAWCDDVITSTNAKNRVFIPNLAALSAFFGKAQIGAGGAIWQGQEFYDTGLGFYLGADASGNAVFSMATANGGKLLFNPAAGVFKLVNPTIDAPVISTQYSVSIPTIDKESQANSTSTYVNYGTLSVTKNNGVGPYEYLWSIGVENGDVIMSGDPSGPSVVIKGRGSNVYSIAWVTVQVRDVGTGISMQASGAVRYQHGTGIIP